MDGWTDEDFDIPVLLEAREEYERLKRAGVSPNEAHFKESDYTVEAP